MSESKSILELVSVLHQKTIFGFKFNIQLFSPIFFLCLKDFGTKRVWVQRKMDVQNILGPSAYAIVNQRFIRKFVIDWNQSIISPYSHLD